MHFGVIAHNTLVGKTDGKALVLHIVGLAGGHKLPLVAALANLHLTYVSRSAKANAVRRLVRKMHGKLVDNRIGVVGHQLLLVSGARLLRHCRQVNLVDVEFLVRSQVAKHFQIGFGVGGLVASFLVGVHDCEDIARCALKFGARTKRLKLALSVRHG